MPDLLLHLLRRQRHHVVMIMQPLDALDELGPGIRRQLAEAQQKGACPQWVESASVASQGYLGCPPIPLLPFRIRSAFSRGVSIGRQTAWGSA